VVDQVAQEYASKPAVFLENNVDTPIGTRENRWWAAWSGGTAYLPLDQVDSGHQVTSGFSSLSQFKTATKAMVDAELARPPQAAVTAYWQRVDSHFRVWVSVTNLTSVTLSYNSNAAEVDVLVWEDVTPDNVHYVTSRYIRAAPTQPLTTPLPSGATASFAIDTPNLSGVNWAKLHCLALVDYRPGGTTGAWDMLQAAIATAPQFAVTPDHLDETIPEGDDTPRTAAVTFLGPSTLTWTSSSDVAWLSVSPTGGDPTTPATVTVNPVGLPAGLYFGTLTFVATGSDSSSFTATLTVTLVRGDVPEASFAGVASTPGQNNTAWRSEVVLHNPTGTASTVRAQIVPRGSTTASASTEVPLAGGQTRLLGDVYAELGVPQGAGTLRLQGQVLAWVRTFNQSTAGTFRQDAVNVVNESFAAGESAYFPIAGGADVQHTSRSNLLVTNLESTALDLTLRCNGTARTVTVPARTYIQLDNIGQTLGLASSVAALEITGPGRWSGSVSTVDPGSGDPTTVRGLSLEAAADRAFPGVARLVGLNNTAWRSELELLNPGSVPVEIGLALLPRGTGTVTASRTLTLAAGELRDIADLYAEMGAADGAACLHVTGSVLAWVRTYNQGSTATYGQDVPGWGDKGFPAGSTARFPVRTPVALATDFRSNLLLLNLEATPVEATVSSPGASLTVPLPAGGYAQVDNVGSKLGLTPGASVLTVTSPGRWAGYVSTVDPVTGDPTTSRGQ
jgi:hypothetical protein